MLRKKGLLHHSRLKRGTPFKRTLCNLFKIFQLSLELICQCNSRGVLSRMITRHFYVVVVVVVVVLN